LLICWGCYKNLTRLYRIEEACEAWRVKDILGLPPKKLNDDRLGRALDTINENPALMGDLLQILILKANERSCILSAVFTTILPLCPYGYYNLFLFSRKTRGGPCIPCLKTRGL